MVEQLDHVNIVVEDLPRMVAFYRDVLGLAVTKEVTISGAWIQQVVGLPGEVVADCVYLDAAGGGTRVELLKYRSPEGTRAHGLGASNAKGIRHVAFRVDDIDVAFDRLRTAGVRFFSAVQEVPQTQVTYKGGVTKRLAYFHDPEGNLLELCEYKVRG